MGPPRDGAHEPDGHTPRLISGHVPARAVANVLLLHGGAEVGHRSVRAWSGPVLRMRPIGWAIRRHRPDLAVTYLISRVRGWNGDGADPRRDAADAVARLRERNPDLPVVLVGHSMGGRVAIHAAGEPQVCGVVALAPWLPLGEPTRQLAGVDLVVLHGTNDRRTSPELSAEYARGRGGNRTLGPLRRDSRWRPPDAPARTDLAPPDRRGRRGHRPRPHEQEHALTDPPQTAVIGSGISSRSAARSGSHRCGDPTVSRSARSTWSSW